MNIFERLLTRLLRLGGSVMLLAALAVLMPRQWMEAAHEMIGLGPFPDEPVAEYLARTASALYAIHGGMLVLTSFDLRRYSPMILYLGITGCCFAATAAAIDLGTGMPLWWALAESLPVLAMNVAFLSLLGLSKRYSVATVDAPDGEATGNAS